MYWGCVFLGVFDGGNNNVWIDEPILLVYFSSFYFWLWSVGNREYGNSCSVIINYEKSLFIKQLNCLYNYNLYYIIL